MKNKIAEHRKTLQLTQNELGKKAGWSQSRIANYESGVREPDLSDCWRLIETFCSLGLDLGFEDVFPNPEESAA